MAMRTHGYRPSSITLAGGATNSDLWLQIHADVSNLPLKLTKVSDACALGGGILAAVGAGWYPDMLSAAREMVQLDRVITPDLAHHQLYAKIMREYMGLYMGLKNVHHRSVHRAALKPMTIKHDIKQDHKHNNVLISASILAADPLHLASEVDRAIHAGVNQIHIGTPSAGPLVTRHRLPTTSLFLSLSFSSSSIHKYPFNILTHRYGRWKVCSHNRSR